ncbi:hypothetical protein BZA77DRAFT_291584 [Pyronema omphalodes]|nr:hypothetical protein BZA77DRAFT_291584 [Pyronema omphalodes]
MRYLYGYHNRAKVVRTKISAEIAIIQDGDEDVVINTTKSVRTVQKEISVVEKQEDTAEKKGEDFSATQSPELLRHLPFLRHIAQAPNQAPSLPPHYLIRHAKNRLPIPLQHPLLFSRIRLITPRLRRLQSLHQVHRNLRYKAHTKRRPQIPFFSKTKEFWEYLNTDDIPLARIEEHRHKATINAVLHGKSQRLIKELKAQPTNPVIVVTKKGDAKGRGNSLLGRIRAKAAAAEAPLSPEELIQRAAEGRYTEIQGILKGCRAKGESRGLKEIVEMVRESMKNPIGVKEAEMAVRLVREREEWCTVKEPWGKGEKRGGGVERRSGDENQEQTEKQTKKETKKQTEKYTEKQTEK